jgi:hypothetical protein
MAELVPAIHAILRRVGQGVGARIKSGHDAVEWMKRAGIFKAVASGSKRPIGRFRIVAIIPVAGVV